MRDFESCIEEMKENGYEIDDDTFLKMADDADVLWDAMKEDIFREYIWPDLKMQHKVTLKTKDGKE